LNQSSPSSGNPLFNPYLDYHLTNPRFGIFSLSDGGDSENALTIKGWVKDMYAEKETAHGLMGDTGAL